MKALFDQFKAAKSGTTKRKDRPLALAEVKVHAAIEAELFYPSVCKTVGNDLMNEADEEHHVARLLLAELDQMDSS